MRIRKSESKLRLLCCALFAFLCVAMCCLSFLGKQGDGDQLSNKLVDIVNSDGAFQRIIASLIIFQISSDNTSSIDEKEILKKLTQDDVGKAWPTIRRSDAEAYRRNFTDQELRTIIDFQQNDAIRKFKSYNMSAGPKAIDQYLQQILAYESNPKIRSYVNEALSTRNQH